MLSNIPKEEVPRCPNCLALGSELRYRVIEHEYDTTTDDWFNLVECKACSAWYLNPRPHVNSLDIIYPKNYYAYAGQNTAGVALNESVAEKLFRSRFDPIARHLPLNSETRWLELGCGQGEVLEGLHRYYGMTKFLGVDYSTDAVSICTRKGYSAVASRMEDLKLAENQTFDIVNSVHLIEHVKSPHEYMTKVHNFLRPGGLCVFTTPNKATWEASLFRRHWGGLHVPRHWTLLDPGSVKILGQKTGFQLEEISFTRAGIFWNWTCHSLAQSAVGRRFADILFPSDHRSNSTSRLNLMRIAGGAVMDIANTRLFGQSSTMVAIFRKPLEG